ncbi:MAG: hypothetical protein OXC41_02985 [Gammaproteobacteria bacterium]|nr:hypothetical protein [Gammaproteobacteria bacterium]
MDLELVRGVLGWCTLVNAGVLGAWFLVFATARDALHRLHGRWFRISPGEFDRVHYMLMGRFKLATVMFFLVPYLVLWSLG